MELTYRTLLFLSASHCQTYIWDGAELSEAELFSNDAGGQTQFSSYLEQHRAPAYLLVDVIEEDFRHETVPHLLGRNRRDLIERKFEQYYRDTPFRQARMQYRHTDGRRDDEMLFSALTNPQQLSPWLDTLFRHGIPLIGIYSLPDISIGLIKAINTDHALLLSWEKHAGLRQTYFSNQHLQFSRLTSIGEHGSLRDTVAAETPRMQHYLSSLNLPSHGTVLDVYILCHTRDRMKLEQSLHSSNELRYAYLDIQKFGHDAKIDVHYLDSDATPLFLHLLARQAPVQHYANSSHTHHYSLWKLHWELLALAAVIALAGALWSAFSIWRAHSDATAAEPLLTQATQLTRETDDLKRKFPVTGSSAADMKMAVTLVREFEHYFPPPEKLLRGLSDVMDQFSRIRADKIAWQNANALAEAGAYPLREISFDGVLLDFGNDYRSSLAYLESFQRSLDQHGYTVSVLKMPLDISPKGSISGDLQAPLEKPAQFTLRLTWRNP
jgi:hypothetical protein